MKIKMIGLGKMGLNLALNMKNHNVEVEGFDVSEEAREKASQSGLTTYDKLEDLSLIHIWHISLMPSEHKIFRGYR